MNKIKNLHLIVGARPNYMKIAPLYHELKNREWCKTSLIHTGQHYDATMSKSFFIDLELPDPDYHLNVGSGSHAEQTGRIMIEYEKYCMEQKPDLVVVVGDVNSTLACALVAAKQMHMVAHLEAGLRSKDMSMPEEINRICTDKISDRLWTPSLDANQNLMAEGIPESRISFVGNIMIDSYLMLKDKVEADTTCKQLNLEQYRYAVVTLHRPANVDYENSIKEIIKQLESISELTRIVFPVHPRTLASLRKYDKYDEINRIKNVIVIEPLPYIKFMNLVSNAAVLVTDSGGIQEETTYLDIPCITVRDNTERPITVQQGTNILSKRNEITGHVERAISGTWKHAVVPDYWDGCTAKRIASDIEYIISM